MAAFELIMPKMGESIMEATILKWNKKPGDSIALDENVLEIATDKVDSEIPSPVAGVLTQIFFNENDVVPIGKVIAIIETNQEGGQKSAPIEEKPKAEPIPQPSAQPQQTPQISTSIENNSNRFYSPLVRTIAQTEGISQAELDKIPGSGQDGRVTKTDIMLYLENRKSAPIAEAPSVKVESPKVEIIQDNTPPAAKETQTINVADNIEIIEMDRMRKLIADHMVMSKHTSPHVTSFVEVDVTEIVQWRNKIKKSFEQKYNQNITFTPLFIQAVVKALQDYPMINVSVEGNKIIKKKDMNIGMAAALPSGNLIVPVIKNADTLNLIGLTKAVNDFASRAREQKLKPEEIQGGTFTITNVGTFGNVMGTPIINQPQVAILATGAIKKKPAVIETTYGDVIAIRHMMFLSLSYDHRVVDGALGGSFLRKIADYLESFDTNQLV